MSLVLLSSKTIFAQTSAYQLTCEDSIRDNDYEVALVICNQQLDKAKATKSLFEEAKIYLSLATISHRLSDTESEIRYLDLVRKHSLFSSNTELQYIWNRQTGKIEYSKKNLKQSKQHFSRALEIAIKENQLNWQGKSFNDLAIVERELENYASSMQYYEKSLELKRQLGDLYSIGITLRSIALTHIKLEEYHYAIQYLNLSLQTLLQQLELPEYDQRIESSISYLYEDFANVYASMGQDKLSREYRNKIIDTLSLKFSATEKARAYLNLSRSFRQAGELEKAVTIVKRAFKIITEEDFLNRIESHFELANLYHRKDNSQQAISEALKGLKLSRQKQSLRDADFLKLLSVLYKETNAAISLHYMEQYQKLREEFLEKKYSNELKTIQHKIETQNIEYELAKNKIHIQKLTNWFLIIIMMLIVSISFFLFYTFKKKKEKEALIQSINYHKQQLFMLDNELEKTLSSEDKNLEQKNPEAKEPITNKFKLQKILVNAMIDAVNIWETHTALNRVELAEQSKIWTVTIDNGTLRTRSLDKYLSLDKIPTNPRWRNVIKTCHFILTDSTVSVEDRTKLEEHLELIMHHIKILSLKS